MIFGTPPATPEAHGVAAHLHRSPRNLHSEGIFVHKIGNLMHKFLNRISIKLIF
jgi:hypothetical protein